MKSISTVLGATGVTDEGAHFQFVGTDSALEAAGKAYYEYRAALMVKQQRGDDQDIQPLPVASDGTAIRLEMPRRVTPAGGIFRPE